jgi:hypothetical protein
MPAAGRLPACSRALTTSVTWRPTPPIGFEGQDVTLVNGTAEQPVRGLSGERRCKPSPMQASGELSGHGRSDAMVILTQSEGRLGKPPTSLSCWPALPGADSNQHQRQLMGHRVIVKNISIDRGTIALRSGLGRQLLPCFS